MSQSSLEVPAGAVPAVTSGDAILELGSTSVVLELEGDRPHLDVVVGGVRILHGLRLGLTVSGSHLGASAALIRVGVRDVVEEWTPRSGKTTLPRRVAHREATLRFREPSGLEWDAIVRLAPDGVAVRYAIPELAGVAWLDADDTTLPLPTTGRTWLLDYQTWYETPRRGVDLEDLPDGEYGFPMLIEVGDGIHTLVTESGIDGRFSGAHARVSDGTLRFALADQQTELARGEVTPWRVFVLGSFADVVESTLVDELAPQTRPELMGADWVRPGRAAWSWWSGFFSGAQESVQREFVDFAAKSGWEHLLIDCGWEDTWVPEIVAYASLRGIQVHLWCVWHDLDGPEKLARLELWRSWGVAGIKVDFMESEAKDRYRWYDTVLQETARLGLMVNFHGSVIPRGWARTWPHVVAYEAIRGAEYYVFYQGTPLTASHNVIQPFTRNVVGGMDYTPVAFTAPDRSTSDGHELALAVAFESGITHFADHVEVYERRPLAARFLAELAPFWDETVLLSGHPDREAVIARRRDDRWFIGAIATGEPRELRVPLHRLGLREPQAWVVADVAGGLREFETLPRDELVVDVAEHGGFVAILAERDAVLHRAVSRQAEAAPSVEPAVAELVDGTAELITESGATLRLPAGWSARQTSAGHWSVRAAKLEPGRLGVVSVELPGAHGIPRIAHARLIAPLTPGIHVASQLPMLAFVNEFGPVERDMSNGGGNPRDGKQMSIAAVEYDDGFGCSSPSSFDLHLGGRADRLTGAVGVDDETPDTAAAVAVLGDGVELFRTDLVSGDPAVELDVDLTGVRILTLTAEPRADTPAHVDWARLRIHAGHHQTSDHR